MADMAGTLYPGSFIHLDIVHDQGKCWHCDRKHAERAITHLTAQRDALLVRHDALIEALESIAEGCSFPADDVQRAIRDRARAAIAAAEEK